MRSGQLKDSTQAVRAKRQHTGPCSDCPWARTALPGWLGSLGPEEWIKVAHSDAVVDCHTLVGARCAGIAIYRRNVCKSVSPPNLKLEADKIKVFAWPPEFIDHHKRSV